MSGKKVDEIPQALVSFELCEKFGWTPDQLDAQDNKVIEEFLVILNAQAEHEKKKNNKQQRKDLAQKFGGVDARG